MLLIPIRYEASTTLYFPIDPQSQQTAATALSALGGGGADPVDIADGLVNSRRCYRAMAIAAKIDMQSAQYAVYTDKHSPQSQITIRIQLGQGQKALAACQAALKEFFSIRDDVEDETKRIVTRQLIAEISKATDELAKEHVKYGKMMEKKQAIPFSSADTLISTEMAVVRQDQLDLDDAEKTYQLLKSNQASAAAIGVELPTTSVSSQKYRDQVNAARLYLQNDEIVYGPASTAVQRDLGALRDAQNLAASEAKKERRAVEANVSPSTSSLGSLGDLDIRRHELRRKLQAAVELVKNLVDAMPTTQRESIRVGLLEQNLTNLGAQISDVQAQAALSSPPWYVLDPPELQPTPVNRSFMKASLLGLLLGLLFVAYRAYREVSNSAKGRASATNLNSMS